MVVVNWKRSRGAKVMKKDEKDESSCIKISRIFTISYGFASVVIFWRRFHKKRWTWSSDKVWKYREQSDKPGWIVRVMLVICWMHFRMMVTKNVEHLSLSSQLSRHAPAREQLRMMSSSFPSIPFRISEVTVDHAISQRFPAGIILSNVMIAWTSDCLSRIVQQFEITRATIAGEGNGRTAQRRRWRREGYGIMERIRWNCERRNWRSDLSERLVCE